MTAEPNAKVAKNKYDTYWLYGVTLQSDFPFENRLAPGVGSPDLTFTCTPLAPTFSGGLDRLESVYASPPLPDGRNAILVYKLPACWVVRFPTADFYLWSDRILCHLPNQDDLYLAEIQLLGVVLAIWLELREVPAMHASAVVIDGRAVAFLSTAGGGKSSIAVSLMQRGYQLLTDDILAVEPFSGGYLGHPGYPQVRMWPEQADHFLGHYEDLDIVHPAFSKRRVPVESAGLGAFCDLSHPLARFYLPERRNPSDWGTRVEIESLSPRDGLLALIGQSFVPEIVESTGLQALRLRFFTSLVSQVPVRRIIYPDGYDHLTNLPRAVLADLA